MTSERTVAAVRTDAVTLRAGAEFLRSLDDGRRISLDGEQV